MRRLSLRTQVIIIVAILAITAVGALQYLRQTSSSARNTIVGLYRERLIAFTGDLAKRYAGVIGFVSSEQLNDSLNALPAELVSVLGKITHERVTGAADIQAGIYHRPSGHLLALSDSGFVGIDRTHETLLRLLIQETIGHNRPEWSHYELGNSTLLLAVHPVIAHNRLIAVAWSYDELGPETSVSSYLHVEMLFQITVVLSVGLAMYLIITLRRDLGALLHGLHRMKEHAAFRLSAPHSELGAIARSINELADTVAQQQQQREHLQQQIQQQEKLASLGRLVAGIAHKIRTPLAAIKTRVQLWERAQKKAGTSRRRRSHQPAMLASTDLVVRELDRMEESVRQLLYFAKHRNLRWENVDLHDSIRTALATVNDSLKRHRIRLTKRFELRNPNLKADRRELHEVFINLFTNAIDAMPRGGSLSITTGESTDGNLVLVTVSDTGVGIPAERASHIFEPFFTTKETGTGLGLSIVYEIVRAHRGTIEPARGVKRGSSFVITLPRKAERSAVEPQEQS